MRKRISVLLVIVAFVLIMIIPTSVYGKNKEILTLEATQSGGEISVSGTAEDGTLAVAIAVYNEDGTKVITMQTAAVDGENKYSDTIKIESGNYLIKVADYEGGAFKEKSVTATEEENEAEESTNTTEENKETNSPKTGDNIALTVTALALSIAGLYVANKNK